MMVAMTQGRPTLYRGVRMRSRLEAQFAARLDEAGYQWAYEPCCYAGAGGQWLPDFQVWAPEPTLLIEVKPPPYSDHLEWPSRMAVAWESDPSLSLMLWTPTGGLIALQSGAQWVPVKRGWPNPPPPTPAQAADRVPENDRLVVALAVHRPVEVAALSLHRRMFRSGPGRSAFDALTGSQTLHEAINCATPEAAVLLQRVAVEEAPPTSWLPDAHISMAMEAGRRYIASLKVGNDADPSVVDHAMTAISHVQRLIAGCTSGRRDGIKWFPDPEASNAAAVELTAFLATEPGDW